MDNKAPDAFRTISEVADDLDLPQHVLRFWESRFHEIKPMETRRRPALLSPGRHRSPARHSTSPVWRGLHDSWCTANSASEQAVKFVQVVWQEGAPQPPHGVVEEEEEFVVEAKRLTTCGMMRSTACAAAILTDRMLYRDRQNRRGATRRSAAHGRAGSAHRSDRSCDPWCRRSRALEHGGTRPSDSATGTQPKQVPGGSDRNM